MQKIPIQHNKINVIPQMVVNKPVPILEQSNK